jgi:hypothetical protein
MSPPYLRSLRAVHRPRFALQECPLARRFAGRSQYKASDVRLRDKSRPEPQERPRDSRIGDGKEVSRCQ